MSKSVQVGPITAKRGDRAFGYLPVATMASGAELGIPVQVNPGAGDFGFYMADFVGVKWIHH